MGLRLGAHNAGNVTLEKSTIGSGDALPKVSIQRKLTQ